MDPLSFFPFYWILFSWWRGTSANESSFHRVPNKFKAVLLPQRMARLWKVWASILAALWIFHLRSPEHLSNLLHSKTREPFSCTQEILTLRADLNIRYVSLMCFTTWVGYNIECSWCQSHVCSGMIPPLLVHWTAIWLRNSQHKIIIQALWTTAEDTHTLHKTFPTSNETYPWDLFPIQL
jgi:hypothetical protein